MAATTANVIKITFNMRGCSEMAINNPYNQYKENSINSATPAELTLMLYNGAIKFTKLAKINMADKNIQEISVNLIKSQDIIDELNITLNMDYEVSKELRSLYIFIKEKLVDANIQKDPKVLDDIIPIMEGMRDTWKEAIEIMKKQKVNTGEISEAVGSN